MNYGYAFTFQFKDDEWIKKFAIAALFTLIPFVGPIFLAGWGLEITRRVIVGDPEPLPPWNDFGNYIIKGIQLIIIGFVYALPIILVQACTQGVFVAGSESFSGDDAFGVIAVIAQTCFGCLTFLYSIFLGLFVPAAIGHFAAEGSFGAAFRFGEIFRILKVGPAAYVIVLLASFVMPFIAMMGLMFCLIGALFTFPYAMTVVQYLYGEAYRACKADLDSGLSTDLEPDVPLISNA
jgi:hypothetical protein